MKYLAPLLALALLPVAAATASPLRKEQVPANAKWLLHVDADQLRSTKVGGVLIKEIFTQVLSDPIAHLKNDLGFDLDLSKVSSITAFGTRYAPDPSVDGVLLIQSDLDLQKALDAAVEKMANAGGDAPLKKTDETAFPLYNAHDQVFIAILPGKLVAIGKSSASVRQEADVLSAKSASMASSKTFSDFPEVGKAFFFLAGAEGFSSDTTIPPQAQVLKMAEGGRVILGEATDHIFLNVSLRAGSSEVVTQIQQAVQGLIALASLSQPDNKDFQQLSQSVKLSTSGKVVSLELQYPVDRMIQQMREKHREKSTKEGDGESGAGASKKEQ